MKLCFSVPSVVNYVRQPHIEIILNIRTTEASSTKQMPNLVINMFVVVQ